MSHIARKQFGPSSEQLRVKNTNVHISIHDLFVGQDVMFQDSISKRWFSATITSLCEEPSNYRIATKDGIIYRKMWVHLKPYKSQNKQCEHEYSTVKKVQFVNSQIWK